WLQSPTSADYWRDRVKEITYDYMGLKRISISISDGSISQIIDRDTGILFLLVNNPPNYDNKVHVTKLIDTNKIKSSNSKSANYLTDDDIVKPIIKLGIIINRIELNPPDDNAGKEWVELYNPTDSSVNISKWKIKSDVTGREFIIPDEKRLDNGGYYVIQFDEEFLENSNESINLIDSEGKLIDKIVGLNDVYDDFGIWERQWSLKDNRPFSDRIVYVNHRDPTASQGQIILLNVNEAKFQQSAKVESNKPLNQIPSWIKNNAGWWSENLVDNESFVNGIEYLVQNEIISIPNLSTKTPSTSKEIPVWIKNTAGWWSNDKITDDEFLKGIEYLVQQGIISVKIK
ncbi:MAG: lamin tail domain-containing protein, partial [Nitrosarchaeum sp.]|nr:lamin tail domain-containing protein [Nitrosarchaeum sp.]